MDSPEGSDRVQEGDGVLMREHVLFEFERCPVDQFDAASLFSDVVDRSFAGIGDLEVQRVGDSVCALAY